MGDLFTFRYKIEGFKCDDVEDIFIEIASGSSSFVDFLVFHQEERPNEKTSIPIYAIEETKTDDSESRNTGVYQRCSKFVFVDFFYPGIKKIMLYNLRIIQKEKASETNIFGTRMLLTIGVEIMGKKLDPNVMKPFTSLNELISLKDSMRLPPKGNVPIKITDLGDKITISGRLFKSGGLSHDPNIGAITIIALCIRKWEKDKEILVTLHGLGQNHIGKTNKFIKIANHISIKLDGLIIPDINEGDEYWHYERSQEKVASIFTHIIVEEYTTGVAIYENHGGAERGYFFDKDKNPVVIKKYQDGQRQVYKDGDKTVIVYIPDLIIYDHDRQEIINIEGKKYSTRLAGINELANYDYIENTLIIPNYHPLKIVRTVVVFGGKVKKIDENEKEIGLILNSEGQILMSDFTPKIIREAVNNQISTRIDCMNFIVNGGIARLP